MRLKYTLLLLCCVSCISAAKPEIKGSPEELRTFLYPSDRTVGLYGEAEETVYTDKAVISLVVTTQADLLADALAQNYRLRQDIAQNLIEAGIPADSINSSKFSTSPQYSWFGNKPDSYEVVNRMAIDVTDESHLQLIAGLADKDKFLEMGSIIFEHTQKELTQQQVRQKALDALLRQKEFYEVNLGLTLTPIAFRESQMQPVATTGARMLNKAAVQQSDAMMSSSVEDSSLDKVSATFDEVKYSSKIYVDYKITTK